MIRNSSNERWVEIVSIINNRDKGCRLLPLLSVKEFILLGKNAKFYINKLDLAHVFCVGAYPHMGYNYNNIVKLNRYSHDCLDSCRNPITGNSISKQVREDWWKRIIGIELYNELLEEAMHPKKNPDN